MVPENSSRHILIETQTFDRLVSFITSMSGTNKNENSILYGDMNSHTSDNPDYVQDDSSVHINVLPDEYSPDIQINRPSHDKGCLNDNGIMLLDLWKQTGLRILNGSCDRDKQGTHTWETGAVV